MPGNTFEHIIDNEITGANCVLVFWSKNSIGSDWVLAEANDGLERGILIPIMLDDVRVPLVFRRKQAAFLIGWPESSEPTEVHRIINAVSEQIQQPTQIINIKKSKHWKRYLPGFSAVIILLGVVFATYQFTLLSERSSTIEPQISITVLPFEGDASMSEVSFEVADQVRDIKDFYVTSDIQSIEIAGNEELLIPDTQYLVRGVVGQSGDLEVSLYDSGDKMWLLQVDIDTEGKKLDGVANLIAKKIASTFNRHLSLSNERIPAAIYLQYLTAKAELRLPPSDRVLSKAQQIFTEVIKQSPKFAEAQAGLCKSYIQGYRETRSSAQFEQAERFCNRAQLRASENSEVQIAMGELYALAGEFDLSQQHLDKALKTSPFSTDAMRALARSYVLQKRFDEAEDILLTAITIEPNYWLNCQLLAGAYFNQGKYQQAADYFDRQTELVMDKTRALADKGAALFMLEDFDQAIEAWELSLRENENDVALTNLGSAYFFNGQYNEAEIRYQRALKLSPNYDRNWANVGETQIYTNKPYESYYVKAIELAEDRLAINPDEIEAISGLAVYYATLGNRSESTKFTKKALLLAGKDVYTVYDIAVAKTRLGDKQDAVNLLARLIEMGYSRTLIDRDANFKNLTLEEI